MQYYIKNNTIFQVQKTGEYTEEKFDGKGKPKKKETYFKFEVLKQFGVEKPQNSYFHLEKESIKGKVFDSLESAKVPIIKKLELKIKQIKNYE